MQLVSSPDQNDGMTEKCPRTRLACCCRPNELGIYCLPDEDVLSLFLFIDIHSFHVFTLLLTPVGMIVQLHVSQVCAARDEEFYSVWKVLTYMIHMMLDYIQCTIESGRNKKCV